MILEQLYLECLSQASYLVGDEASRRAIVVDPRRDVQVYLDRARQLELEIGLVVLTHLHADFVPGHTELSEATGAEVAMGQAAPVAFPVRRLADGERISLGDVETGVVVQVLSTPGHTPDSITLAVYQRATDAVPVALLTGDTLFLGDVGRPDLLGGSGLSPAEMAGQLYRSLHDKLLAFPDQVLVYPGHGAGSSCGKALSVETVSTLGEQRRLNYALAPMGMEDFVRVVTEGLSAPPEYFADEVAINRSGHAAFDPARPVPPLGPAEVLAHSRDGELVLDVRPAQDFWAGHLRGSVNLGLSGRFAEYAAALHPRGAPVVLVGSPEEVLEARLRLARVGIDTVVGALTDASGLASHPELLATSSRLTAAQAAARMATVAGLQVVDVRAPAEFAAGCLPGARNIVFSGLRAGMADLDPRRPVLVNCASGYRSIAAASLLEARGFADVSDLLGGWASWEAEQVRSGPGA